MFDIGTIDNRCIVQIYELLIIFNSLITGIVYGLLRFLIGFLGIIIAMTKFDESAIP